VLTSNEFEVMRVGEVMATRGWLPDLVGDPHATHLMLCRRCTVPARGLPRDLRDAVEQLRNEIGKTAKVNVTY
jgi:hypothetical protein